MRIRSLIISAQTIRCAGLLSVFVALATACGGAAVQEPVVPGPGSAPAGPPAPPAPPPPKAADPFAVPESPRDEAAEAASSAPVSLDAWQKAKKAKGVGPSPSSCPAHAKKVEKGNAVERAQRADLSPVECADAIVDPLLETLNAGASKDTPDNVRLAIGFSLAGKLARTALAPPSIGSVSDKEKVKAFITGPLKTWAVEQSTAIELLSSGAAGLTGYARGISAIEAGIAELRLVDKIRSAPVPASWDAELKAIYEAALDEALEPRKKRGRDAALVGLSDLAKAGVLRDPRIDRARVLLAKLYGGRRVDALDGLLLPAPAPVPAAQTPEEKAIATTPTFWLDGRDFAVGKDQRVLSRGVTAPVRDHFRKVAADPADEARSPYARARLDMGRVYWRRVDFVEAAHAAAGSTKPEDRLVLAVSLALAQGPNGAAEMMRASTPSALDLKHTEALDALAAPGGIGGALAGMAAYDAAHLRALSPPDGDDAAPYWADVAARFRKAETLLTDPAHKKSATTRAAESDAIAKAAKK
jgi:hypothetical protein